MLKEQAEVKNVQYSRMTNQYFLSLTEMRLWFANVPPFVPLRGWNKYKKKNDWFVQAFMQEILYENGCDQDYDYNTNTKSAETDQVQTKRGDNWASSA